MESLQSNILLNIGKVPFSKMVLPDFLVSGLNPNKHLRPYQENCFKYFISYMDPENGFVGSSRPHLLFQMATGSGKTLIMAGAILYLYSLGYRNFLFFVSLKNIVEKTKDNFVRPWSSKYLFAPNIYIDGKLVQINEVESFQATSPDAINLYLTTMGNLHEKMNNIREGEVGYEDFSDKPVVLIADEAHHLSASTKARMTVEEQENITSWESTVMRIFNQDNGNKPNILLEFTATGNLDNEEIANKYIDKLIFDYPLRTFCSDRYSKNVEVAISDLDFMGIALQACIMSQFKRKLFASINQNVKPVVLFKSKSINESTDFYDSFVSKISSLKYSDITGIREHAKGEMKTAFDYFDKNGITTDNLIIELKEDFSSDKLLLLDSKNISDDKQRKLNSLEDKNNMVRGIFAVDMLNEGWDVLNLFDIVRLYNTRDANNNRPGKTTTQEAQLIGRGARYMPFYDPKDSNKDFDKRKYDSDTDNPLREIETLHYHSQNNSRYIQELHTALVESGVVPNDHKQLELFLKEDFKKSRLYTKGIVFENDRIPVAIYENDGTIGSEIKRRKYVVRLSTGQVQFRQLMEDDSQGETFTSYTINIKLGQIGYHIVRAAMNCFPVFNFNSLSAIYLQLKSCKEFVESNNYLASLDVEITSGKNELEKFSRDEKYSVAKEVLKQLSPLIGKRGQSFKGSHEFKAHDFNSIFRDRIVMNIKVDNSGDKEYGISQRDSLTDKYRLDLMRPENSWYAYNDNYGTSEEKALVRYIHGVMPKLQNLYSEIYLVRNELDLSLYSFDEGRKFQPDFVLFLRKKGKDGIFDNLQLFIEPKGNGLLKQDKWKNDFLKQIKSLGEVYWITQSDLFNVWGLPFFNEDSNNEFQDAFIKDVLNGDVTQEVSIKIWDSTEISDEKKFTLYVPLFSVKAACGSFADSNFNPDDIAEGWIDVTEYGVKPNDGMFIVHAIGDSMSPVINNGDLCLFEQYGKNCSGTREGEIVLTQCASIDNDYGCSCTIKKYHSEKLMNEGNDTWAHKYIILFPLNKSYKPILLTQDDEVSYRTLGIFKQVLK